MGRGGVRIASNRKKSLARRASTFLMWSAASKATCTGDRRLAEMRTLSTIPPGSFRLPANEWSAFLVCKSCAPAPGARCRDRFDATSYEPGCYFGGVRNRGFVGVVAASLCNVKDGVL